MVRLDVMMRTSDENDHKNIRIFFKEIDFVIEDELEGSIVCSRAALLKVLSKRTFDTKCSCNIPSIPHRYLFDD